MKREEHDILQNAQLKNSPFEVPENYFSSLNESLNNIPKRNNRTSIKKWVSYTAVAATFALLVAGGGLFLKWSESESNIGYAEAQEITREDIIEYLIYTGVEVEDLEDLDLY